METARRRSRCKFLSNLVEYSKYRIFMYLPVYSGFETYRFPNFCGILEGRTGFQARMSLLDDAVAKYNKLPENGPFRDLAWAEALHQRMETLNLSAGGRLICPFLRPNFLSRRQYDSLV